MMMAVVDMRNIRRSLALLIFLRGAILAAIVSSSLLPLSQPLHRHRHCHRHRGVGGGSGFLSSSPPYNVLPAFASARSHQHCHRRHHHSSSTTSISSMIPFFVSPFNLLSEFMKEDAIPTTTKTKTAAAMMMNGGNSYTTHNNNYCYVPPYGMVPRATSLLTTMMMSNNNISDYYYPSSGNDNNFDRSRSTSRRNVKDPLIQDFGSLQDWRSSKIGVGRLGDNKVGDDMVNEGRRARSVSDGMRRRMRRGRLDVPPPPLFEDGEGGNFWVNPTDSMDRYPEPPIPPMMMDDDDDGYDRRGEMLMMMSSRDGRRNSRSGRIRDDDDDGEWWETRRRLGRVDEDDDIYYDDDDDDADFLDRFDDDYFDSEDDENIRRRRRLRQRGGEYGVPPPTRSRSSFRTGAPPPPRPIKQFYDKLFWFGFDPDATQPTDRTMFGGTRGKFNAVDLLRDREERQRYYRGSGGGYNNNERRRRIPPGSSSTRSGRDSVIQDFGSVQDWNARKTGRGRAGGDAVGDDVVVNRLDFDSRFDDDYFPSDDDDAFNDVGRGRVAQRGRNSRGGERQQQQRRRSVVDSRAEEYNRIIGLGPTIDDDDDEYLRRSFSPSSSRRRSGFAYKYNDSDIDLLFDDGEYIDVEPRYASERDLDMARAGLSSSPPESFASRRRRRRSWEERAMEMDRVPPRDAIAWGPNGPAGSGGESPLESAAMDALREIKKSKLFLEKKENDVEDAKNEVVNLKANASQCQSKLEAVGGREASRLEQELGYILRDVDDASRNLRLARAERDAASNRVSDLEERNWALLSEYEATRSFEDDLVG